MATMRRVDLSAITFLLVGTLCGALLIFGVGSLRHSDHHTAPSMVVTSSSSEMSPPIGGRLGGINSSDTVNDSAIRQGLKADADAVVGGRLGGIASSDTANDWSTRQSLSTNDAIVKTPVSRIIGPGEGLNQSEQQRLMEQNLYLPTSHAAPATTGTSQATQQRFLEQNLYLPDSIATPASIGTSQATQQRFLEQNLNLPGSDASSYQLTGPENHPGEAPY